HPPLLQRIQALEPSFKGENLARLQAQWMASPPDGLDEDMRLGLHGGATTALPHAGAQARVTPPMVAAQVAQPQNDDYLRADAIVAGIGEELHAIATRRDLATPLLLGLLLDGDARVRGLQHEEIAARLGKSVAGEAVRLREERLAGLHPMFRLPLAALAFPVLRLRP